MSGVRVEVSPCKRVWTVIIDRPTRKNAVNGPAARALFDSFIAFDRDSTACVAVLWGAGGTFCAGADLQALSAQHEVNPMDSEGHLAPMGPSRLRLTKPVIAAVSGYAVAGGLELAIWCDLRVCEENSVFGVFCRRWGVPLIDGGTVRLPRLIGVSRASDMILTGRGVGASEALSWGLANRVVAVGEARSAAEKLALELCSFPQGTMRSDRSSMLRQEIPEQSELLPVEQAMRHEYALGLPQIPQAIKGATVFKGGAGRHGAFFDAKL